MAGEAHAGQHVDVEHALPVLVGNGEGLPDFVDADVVDENIDRARGLDDGGDAGRCRRVARGRNQPGVRQGGADFADRRLDVGGLAAVDDDFGAARRKLLRHGKADAFCRTGDKSAQT